MRIFFYLFFSLMCSCGFRAQNTVGNDVYTTGHLGMPGEYKFIFKENRYFYYYRSVPGFYSEGEIHWVDKNRIDLVSLKTGEFDSIPYLMFQDLTGTQLKIKKDKLYFGKLFLIKQ